MIELRKDKPLAVTGGAGFVGRHVVRALQDQGYLQVVVPRRVQYDFTREEAVERFYREVQPEAVIHLAGVVGGIGVNLAHPGRFFYENLTMGTLLMEYARRYGVKKFVAIGTICSYPKFTPVPFKEEDLWNGYPEETNAPYGLAKKMLLVQAQAYRKEYGFNAIYLLPVNLYGPEDHFDLETSHVIPALIRKCLEAIDRNEPEMVCWGDGSPTREFLYVEDCAEAVVLALERYHSAEPVNLGSGFEISIKELVHLIAQTTGFKGRVVWDTTKPNGQPRRCLDTSRAWEGLGFRAKTDFKEGLRRTVEWYRQHRQDPPLTRANSSAG